MGSSLYQEKYMICLIQNIEDYNNDFRVMLQAFFGGERIVIPEIYERDPSLREKTDRIFKADIRADGIEVKLYAVEGVGFSTEKVAETYIPVNGDVHDKALVRNPLKLALYNMLSDYTGRKLPWGSLTGIRPTKIALAHMEQGIDDESIVDIYEKTYGAGRDKGSLAVAVAKHERRIIQSVDEENEYCLYVGIPFCPSRCLYCSFTSYPIATYQNRVWDYIYAMEKELEYVSKVYSNKRLISLYIGGGTPSSLTAEQMDRLCDILEKNFDLSFLREYTIEAGRPDSTTRDKLEVMKEHGVTRISINPQTMNDETLRLIGRAHDSGQTIEAMNTARAVGFDNINMDLIVGLPGENVCDVRRTLETVSSLHPESLTVHTLAIKRAANLNIEMDKYRNTLPEDAQEQLAEVTQFAGNMGLSPYYLYRQKNMAGNLENIGYSRPDLECLYNILIMEERTDIVGIGAGSSTKLVIRPGVDGVTEGTRIDRVENCKSVDDYINRIDEMIDRKKKEFQRVRM